MGITNMKFLAIWNTPLTENNKEHKTYYRDVIRCNTKKRRKTKSGQFVLPNINGKIKGRYLKILKKESMEEDLPVIRPILNETIDQSNKNFVTAKKASDNKRKTHTLNKTQCTDRLLDICKSIKEIIENPKIT